MDIRNLIKETVVHKSFGKGVIRNAYDKYLEVDFLQSKKQSKFIYPVCFSSFLRLESEEKEKDIAEDITRWRKESGADEKEKLRQQYETTQEGIRARRTAAAERRQRIAQRSMEHRSSAKGVQKNNGRALPPPLSGEAVKNPVSMESRIS